MGWKQTTTLVKQNHQTKRQGYPCWVFPEDDLLRLQRRRGFPGESWHLSKMAWVSYVGPGGFWAWKNAEEDEQFEWIWMFFCCFNLIHDPCRHFFGKDTSFRVGKGIYTIIHIYVKGCRMWFPRHLCTRTSPSLVPEPLPLRQFPFSEWREPSKVYLCLKRHISNHV